MRLNLQYFLSITFYIFFISSCTNKNSEENKRTEACWSDSTKVASNDTILIQNNGDFESKLALSTKSINYDSLYEHDSFYQLRKGKFKSGETVKIDGIYYSFADNLLLKDTIKNHTGVEPYNNEIAPGIIKVEHDLAKFSNPTPDYNFFWPHHLIYLNDDLSIEKKIILSDYNPISIKNKKVTNFNQFDSETNIANNRKENPQYDVKKNTHHYWTRPIDLTSNDAGFIAIKYALSLRDINDSWVDDLNCFLVFDKHGNVLHRMNNMLLDVGSITISPCGNFLIIQYGGTDAIRNPSSSIYELKTGKKILHFNHFFQIPIFDMENRLLFMGYMTPELDKINIYQAFKIFNFDKREYYDQQHTRNQWKEIEKNFAVIKTHFNIFKMHPFVTTKF